MTPVLLFDLDGTMLDSDPLHEAVFADLLAERGITMDEGFYHRHVHGRLNVDVFAEFLPEEPDPQGLSEWKETQFREQLPRPYPATPGLRALLDRADRHAWKRAVVTNAMRINAEAMLEAVELRDRFDIIVIGEECPRGKPDPYPYTEAMRLLNAAPADCIAFEDSPSGIAAAAAAGAFTVGLRSSLSDAALRDAGAHLTIADFEDPALETLLAHRPEQGVSA